MCLMGILTGRYGSSAKVADGRLVISLPDAESPVVWVMDLAEASTSVLRLEQDKQGLSVIKKYGAKGAAETVAVYRNRNHAERALRRASRALEKARDSHLHKGANGQPVIIRPASRIARVFTLFLYLWFATFWTIQLLPQILSLASLRLVSAPASTAAASATPQGSAQQPAAPAASTAAPAAAATAVGVPLSADEFLKNNMDMPVP